MGRSRRRVGPDARVEDYWAPDPNEVDDERSAWDVGPSSVLVDIEPIAYVPERAKSLSPNTMDPSPAPNVQRCGVTGQQQVPKFKKLED
jgi:hypothetical protein